MLRIEENKMYIKSENFNKHISNTLILWQSFKYILDTSFELDLDLSWLTTSQEL